MQLYLIASGTIELGFTFIGPFTHIALATEWAENWEEDITWEILPIINPIILEKERAHHD